MNSILSHIFATHNDAQVNSVELRWQFFPDISHDGAMNCSLNLLDCISTIKIKNIFLCLVTN